MKTQISQSNRTEAGGYAEPICADGDLFCGTHASGSNLIQLPKDASGFGVVSEPRLDVFELLESGPLQVMAANPADFTAARSGSRPSDELLVFGDKGQAKFGFKILNGAPVGTENSDRVGDDDPILIEFYARGDDEQPNGEVNGAQAAHKAWQTSPTLGGNRSNQAEQGNDAGADSGIDAYFRSKSSHDFNYPNQKTSEALKMHEEN